MTRLLAALALAALAALSFRDIPVEGEEMAQLLREIIDRLEALENGGAIRGIVSFGPVIQVGDVRVRVVQTTGDNRDLEFENVLTGASFTITL